MYYDIYKNTCLLPLKTRKALHNTWTRITYCLS